MAITGIDPDSDAADKGIKEGEKITSVNNQEVSSADDIVKVLDQAKKDGRTRALFQIQSSERKPLRRASDQRPGLILKKRLGAVRTRRCAARFF